MLGPLQSLHRNFTGECPIRLNEQMLDHYNPVIKVVRASPPANRIYPQAIRICEVVETVEKLDIWLLVTIFRGRGRPHHIDFVESLHRNLRGISYSFE